MNTQIFPLTGLHCANCVRKVSEALAPFAQTVNVSLEPMQAQLLGLKPDADMARMQAALSEKGAYILSQAAFSMPNASISLVEHAGTAIKNEAVENASASFLKTYRPLLLLLGYILIASFLVQLGQHDHIHAQETMRYFMAGFFLCFSFFKLLDLPSFVDAYAGYDLLAARWHGWGLIYPFVELVLGLAYLAHWQPVFTAWVTIIVMGFSAIGVIRAVASKQKIRCACLGAVFNLPMSTVTIVEDVGMVLMAATMLMF